MSREIQKKLLSTCRISFAARPADALPGLKFLLAYFNHFALNIHILSEFLQFRLSKTFIFRFFSGYRHRANCKHYEKQFHPTIISGDVLIYTGLD